MKKIANERKAFRARWKTTEGSLSEFGYEPEDESKESNGSKEVSHAVTAKEPNRTSESRMMLNAHRIERPQHKHIL